MAKITTITTSSLKKPDPAGVLLINKPVGQTPKQLIDKLKARYPHTKNIPVSFAGRLDPMASGLMLILVGKATNQNRETYLSLDKHYRFNILWGIATDTYDPLGVITQSTKCYHDTNHSSNKTQLSQAIKCLAGELNVPYPPYSAKAVSGKPLWWWAKKKRLHEIDIPTNHITIKKLTVNQPQKINSADLVNQCIQDIQTVSGDFRQNKIISQWQLFKDTAPPSLLASNANIHASSGTYVRQIAHLIGQRLGSGALAFGIHRTQVGKFSLDQD